MNINIFKQNNKFYFNEDKFYNKKQDLVKAISRELGYPHKEALKYVNNKLGKPTSKKDKEEYYKNKIMMLERRVAYLEDKLNEKLNKFKTVVSCEVSKPIEKLVSSIIEWEKPEPIKDHNQNEYLINMNETKRLLSLLEKQKEEEPKEEEPKILTKIEEETDKIIISTKSLEMVGVSRYEEDVINTENYGEAISREDDDICNYYFTDEDSDDQDIDLNEIFTDEDTDEEEEEYGEAISREEKLSNNNIDMTQPIINVNKDNLEKITLRDNDSNKSQQFYKYIVREEGKEVKIIILTKTLQKVGVCRLWTDKNIDEEFRNEDDIINLDGEELYEIIITVPELTRLDKQLFREFKYTPHYNNLTETNEYFEGWLSQ